MATRRNSRTYPDRVHAKPAQARQELTAPRNIPPAEEPMRRWPHPIPTPAALPARSEAPEQTQTAALILEQLSCQSQLMVDLLGAVNSLTAAVLCQAKKS